MNKRLHASRLASIATLAFLLLSSVPVGTAITAHEFVKDTDATVVKLLTATFPTNEQPHLVCRDSDGVSGCGIDDDYFIHFGVGTDTVLKENDLKIAGSGPGQWLTASGTHTGQTFTHVGGSASILGTVKAPLRCIELDGINGWTELDGLVLDIGVGAIPGGGVGAVNDGKLGVGDVVLTNVNVPSVSLVAGSIIKTVTEALPAATQDASKYPRSASLGCVAGETATTFLPLWFDKTRNGAIDSLDGILVSPPGMSNVYPERNDVALSPSALGYATFGTHLTSVSTGVRWPTATLTGTAGEPLLAVRAPTASETLTQNALYIHFPDPDGVNNVILENDLQITGVSRSPGTRVTSESSGQGIDAIGCGSITGCTVPTSLLSANIFSLDVDGITGLTAGDPVFINRPTTMGGGSGACEPCISAGDVRLTAAATGGYGAGSVVEVGHADLSAYGGITGTVGWEIKLYDHDGMSTTFLDSLTGAHIGRRLAAGGTPAAAGGFSASCTGVGPFPGTSDACHAFDSVNDNVYTGCPSTVVATGCTRIYVGTGMTGGLATGAVTCPGDSDCPSGANDVGTLAASPNLRVSGTDASYEVGQSEGVYWSLDDKVGPGDGRITARGGLAAGYVATDDKDAVGSPITGSSDRLVAALDACSAPPTGCWPFPDIHDVFLTPWGQRLTASSAEVAPHLTLVSDTTNALVRYNRNDAGSVSDDTFYLAFPGSLPPTALTVGDLRLSSGPGGASGLRLKSADSEELSASNRVYDSTVFTSRIGWLEIDGFAGPTQGDMVFANTHGLGVTGTAGAIDAGDIRLSRGTLSGSSLAGGTIVQHQDADRASGISLLAPTGPARFFVYYWDENRNGVQDGDDDAYLHYSPTGAVDLLVPHVNDLALMGPGGSTVSTNPVSPPSGGSTPSSTPTTPTSPTTPTTPPATPPATPPSTVGDYTDVHVAAANTALGMTLKVTRSGGSNMLEWEDVVGEAGYEIWAANSPFAVIGTLGPGQTSFTHADAPRDTKYIVTAFFENPDGSIIGKTAATTGADERPALPGMSDIEPAEAPGGESTPGPGFILALAALAVAFLARRRK